MNVTKLQQDILEAIANGRLRVVVHGEEYDQVAIADYHPIMTNIYDPGTVDERVLLHIISPI